RVVPGVVSGLREVGVEGEQDGVAVERGEFGVAVGGDGVAGVGVGLLADVEESVGGSAVDDGEWAGEVVRGGGLVGGFLDV
ncbi:hypothetical protein, partial [Kocuria rosea]|uniref:hypothetical protein n=1 Tax=Kocuria rosea TaxID=1275 RepID=UPI001C92F6D8